MPTSRRRVVTQRKASPPTAHCSRNVAASRRIMAAARLRAGFAATQRPGRTGRPSCRDVPAPSGAGRSGGQAKARRRTMTTRPPSTHETGAGRHQGDRVGTRVGERFGRGRRDRRTDAPSRCAGSEIVPPVDVAGSTVLRLTTPVTVYAVGSGVRLTRGTRRRRRRVRWRASSGSDGGVDGPTAAFRSAARSAASAARRRHGRVVRVVDRDRPGRRARGGSGRRRRRR